MKTSTPHGDLCFHGIKVASWFCATAKKVTSLVLVKVGRFAFKILAFYIWLVTGFCVTNLLAQVGSFDPTFTPTINGPVNSTLVQADGKLLVAGNFTEINGTNCKRIARINPDGTLDSTFIGGGLGIDGPINCIAVQPSGQIFIAGDFQSVGGSLRGRVACLNSDGSLNSTFVPSTGANASIQAIAYNSFAGKILIGGEFLSVNGSPRGHLAQFNADGTLDNTAFNGAGANGPVYAIQVVTFNQPSSVGIYIGGSFTSIMGSSRNNLAKFDYYSSFVNPFFNSSGGPDAAVRVISSMADSQFLIGGDFTMFGASPRAHLAAISNSGSLDISLDIPVDGSVRTILAFSPIGNGNTNSTSVVLGGSFTQIGGVVRNNISRLLKNSAAGSGSTSWSIDANFQPIVDAPVLSAALESDGKCFIGGQFAKVNGSTANNLARLYGDGGTSAPAPPELTLVGPGTDAELIVIWNGVPYSSGYKIERSPNGFGEWTQVGVSQNGSPYFPWIDSGLDSATTYFYRVKAYSTNGDGIPSTVKSGRTLDAPWLQAGSVDTNFTAGTGMGANSWIYTTLVQPDGKILIGGVFSKFNLLARSNLARLNSDGTLDTTFTAFPNSGVTALALQPDGKILIGGDFSSVAGTSRNRIARLNADGSLDTSFSGSGTNFGVESIALQADGKAIIAGRFTVMDGATHNGIARLNQNGTVDPTFNASLSFSDGFAVAVQTDGKILVAGFFQSANSVARGNIARFNPDGTLDPLFAANAGANSWIEDLQLQPDGRILIAGTFNTYDGVSRKCVARLLSNGSLDTTFVPATGVENAWAFAIARQNDGKVIVGGWFTIVSGSVRSRICRFNSNGSIDNTFQPGLGANNDVRTIAVESDEKILAGGLFQTMNGLPSNYLARLNADNGSSIPHVPADPRATTLSSSTISFSWSLVPFVSNYKIFTSPDGVNGWTQVGTVASTVPNYTVTGLAPGSTAYYSVQAISTNGESLLTPGISLTTYSPYQQWKSNHSLPLDYPDTATPANDGISLLLKYALGLEPNLNSQAGLPFVYTTTDSSDGTYISLCYTEVLSATDITYILEFSDDLKIWQLGTNATMIVSSTTDPNGKTKSVIFRDKTPLSELKQRFIRLRVSH